MMQNFFRKPLCSCQGEDPTIADMRQFHKSSFASLILFFFASIGSLYINEPSTFDSIIHRFENINESDWCNIKYIYWRNLRECIFEAKNLQNTSISMLYVKDLYNEYTLGADVPPFEDIGLLILMFEMGILCIASLPIILKAIGCFICYKKFSKVGISIMLGTGVADAYYFYGSMINCWELNNQTAMALEIAGNWNNYQMWERLF